MIAEGIIGAVKEVGVKVRLSSAWKATTLNWVPRSWPKSGLNIIAATSLTDAAQQVVKAAEGK